MPRITPNACVRLLPRFNLCTIRPCIVPFPVITFCTICHASRPMESHSSPCVAYATHHPQCMRASPSKIQLVHHMPRITPNAFPCIVPFRASPCVPYATHHAQYNSVIHIASHMPWITPMRFRASSPSEHHLVVLDATHQAQCVSEHRPLLSNTLCTTCHSSRPMQFCESPCIPSARHHPKRFRASTISEHHCVADATHHPQCVCVSPSKT